MDDVREFMFTDHPWLAADPTLGPWQQTADLDVVQAGAWILPDERPFLAEPVAFLDAGTPPVYVGFGSMRGVPEDIARVAIEAIRAQRRRVLVGHGWADLVPPRRPPGPVLLRWWCPRREGTSRTGRPGWPSWGSGRDNGATVAAKLLLEAVSRDTPHVSA